MSVLQKLTEGIVERDLQKEGSALLSKWEATGLLEGIESDSKRSGMARLLENQAKQLLKEASSMAAGDVEGFAAVAFPIVRRVFGGLVANDLVSVQPMSLPSGLIFFLDFTYQEDSQANPDLSNQSVYGGGVVGQQLTGGVASLTGSGFYNFTNAYSSPTGSTTALDAVTDADPGTSVAGEINCPAAVTSTVFSSAGTTISSLSEDQKKAIRFDPDILAQSAGRVYALQVHVEPAEIVKFNFDMMQAFRIDTTTTSAVESEMGLGANNGKMVRRLTERGFRDENGVLKTSDPDFDNYLTFYYVTNTDTADTLAPGDSNHALSGPVIDQFNAAGSRSVGGVVGADNWGLEEPLRGTGTAGTTAGKVAIPEIDIKVDSVSVTAITKKLKAKWSPELGQDLNAYHNLDAEVELTGILSEHIALEIDREILNDLIQGATAGTYYWARSPGLFVHRTKGTEIGQSSAAPDFTGTVSEWYETLVETINDVSAQIHRKTLRGGANFLVVSPEVANILEFTSGFRASVTADDDRGTVGAVKVGAMSKKFDVYVDPYFPRNVVLVGRNGGSFLESGYVYAPYVPLQVTPTIFGTEDFVPRKGVMTRYAKKMVRPDMYGLVICRGLLGESGAS